MEDSMFTGIMSCAGRVIGTIPLGGGTRFRIEAPELARDLAAGDRVAVNGVNHEVIEKTNSELIIETAAEALSKTTMGDVHVGSQVNLEPALRLVDRLRGRMVEGCIDCVGSVVVIERRPSSWLVSLEFPLSFARYVVSGGGVALDGISMNVVATQGNRFTVAVDPESIVNATLGRAVLGTRVNLEFDLIGKYVEKILKEGRGEEPDLELREKLRGWGYDN
jgi:riboflavin synthase